MFPENCPSKFRAGGLGFIDRFGEKDELGTLGEIHIDRSAFVIDIELNVQHPQIRAAALSGDHELLSAYVWRMCSLGVGDWLDEHLDWPWRRPDADWQEFRKACNIRSKSHP